MGTKFTEIYNRFLGKITDDMYVELTPQDTIRDLRNLLIDAIPGFEFPRHNLYDYSIESEIKFENEIDKDDFIIGILWDEMPEDSINEAPRVEIERSSFTAELTSEEINILAILMMCAWV